MVFEKIVARIAERMGCAESEITMESRFADMGIDSLDVMEVLMLLEDDLGTEIETGEEKLETVADLVQLIETKLGEQSK